jgi:hypothetical protein
MKAMNRYSAAMAALAASVAWASCAQAQAPMAQPAQTAGTDGETTLRCTIPSDAAIYAREAGSIPSITRGTPIVKRTGSAPPKVMVDGWRPATAPLSVVLADLGREAGFAVTGAEGLGPVSWTRDSAPLSDVLDNLTSQVGGSWSFSSGVVHVSRTPMISSVPASMRLPANRDVTLALLDTLRGYDATGVALSPSGISFSSSPAGLSRIQSGLAGVGEVFAFDVTFMQGRPTAGRYSWSGLAGGSVVADGVGGRMLLGEDGSEVLARFLASAGDVRQGGAQTVAGPSGWALVVPQAQCGSGTAELTIKPKRVGDGFSMQIAGMGATPVDVPMVTLGQTLVVASRDPVGGWINVVSIRPRILAVR